MPEQRSPNSVGPSTPASAGVPGAGRAQPAAPAQPAAQPAAPGVNPYAIKKPQFGAAPTRPDQVQAMQIVRRRKQYLPTMYGLWWMATLVFFLLVSALTAFHTLQYQGYDPLAIRWETLQDKYVFMSLGGAMLATLFLIWVLQNTAKGLTNSKPNPETAYNNVYGIMLCLLIIGSMKLTNDAMAETTDTQSGGQLQWLRDNAWGFGDDPAAVPTIAPASAQAAIQTANQAASAADSDPANAAAETAPTANLDSPIAISKPAPSKAVTSTGRNLPQARPQTTSGSTQIRVGDPTKSVMASAMRAFQSAAGRVRLADQRVMATPQPDLANLTFAAPIEAVAVAHLDAFEAHLEMARIATTLPDTAKVQMLGAGASVNRTEEQVASLRSLLSLNTAVTIHNAEAGVHGARAAYAGFLAQHFGKWAVTGGTVTFDDAELGATAVDLQRAIGLRETELKATKYDAVGG
ncbi:MAG: hypothetical protein ACI89L_001738 [Phycisphaerales bacterium]|jgi:hypothetical protein